MVKIGQVWRAKPGKAEDYRRFHAAVPDVVARLFRDCGVADYTLFAWGDVVFACLEVEDYDALIERNGRHPEAQSFETEAATFCDFDLDPATGWPVRLDRIWSLQDQLLQIEDRR